MMENQKSSVCSKDLCVANQRTYIFSPPTFEAGDAKMPLNKNPIIFGHTAEDPEALGILAHLLRMVSWNVNTFRFGGDWRPLAHPLTR